MAKICTSCEERDAEFCIKGSSECYCKECAIEHFGDLGVLVGIEDNANLLKRFVDDQFSDKTSSNEDLINVEIKSDDDK